MKGVFGFFATLLFAAAAFAGPTGPGAVAPYSVCEQPSICISINGTILKSLNETAPHILYSIGATAPTVNGTSEQILGSYTLPANALDRVGRRIRITAAFATAANTNSKTPKLYFGAGAVAPAATTTASVPASLSLTCYKTGTSTQQCWGSSLAGAAGITPLQYSAALTEDETAGIVIKATCTDGTSSAGDCTLVDFVVEWLN